MRTRDVIALGIGQCVNWGVLYYAFAVLLLPLEAELGASRWAVIGAFSLALLVSALLAPVAGRWADRGKAPTMMLVGGLTAAAILLVWASMPGLLALYISWTALGACMALTLYEPAFAIVGQHHAEPATRLRSLALVTLVGGLASTVFLPLTSALVRGVGWRGAVIVLSVVLAGSTWVTRTVASDAPAAPSRLPSTHPERPGIRSPARHPDVTFLRVVFGLASLSSTAVVANLVPAVVERQLTPTTAALLGGTFGVLQLPGRALMLRESFAVSPFRLLAISLGLQGVGLIAWASAPGAVSVVAGLMLFAVGAGLTTLARPYLVQTALSGHPAGYINGQLAQVQHLSRAAGPAVVAGAAQRADYGVILLVLGLGFAVMAAAALQRAYQADARPLIPLQD